METLNEDDGEPPFDDRSEGQKDPGFIAWKKQKDAA
jgi:hypothetical protein